MTAEQQSYEAGWRFCARCGTRRPQAALINGECAERTWCDQQLPNCDVCTLPVPQPVRGRRLRHPGECEGQDRKQRNAGVNRNIGRRAR